MSLSAFTSLWASVIFQVGILHLQVPSETFKPDLTHCVLPSLSRIRASTTPVTFSWTGDDQFELVGETTVYPGYEGHAWVLQATKIPQNSKPSWPTRSSRPTRYVQYLCGTVQIPPNPSLSMVNQIKTLLQTGSQYSIAADAAHSWFAGTRLDPMPIESPPLLNEQLLIQFSKDPHKGVRRRVLHMLRHPPYSRTAANSSSFDSQKTQSRVFDARGCGHT